MNVVLRFASSCNLVVLFVVDGRRTVVFRRYVASRGCPVQWHKLVNRLPSAVFVVSMTVLVVL